MLEHTSSLQHMHDTELDAILRHQRIDVLAQEANLATGYQTPFGAQQTTDCLQRCALAGAVGAQQRDHATLRHIN